MTDEQPVGSAAREPSSPPQPTGPKRRFHWSELVLPLVAGGAILVSFFYRSEGLPGLQVCWFRGLTSWPCPGCGLTRAFCAISHGDFAAAWKFNPFGFVFYAVAILLVFWPLLQRRFPGAATRLTRSRMAKVAAVAFAVILWTFGILRILTQ